LKVVKPRPGNATKSKTYNTVETVLKSNRKMIETKITVKTVLCDLLMEQRNMITIDGWSLDTGFIDMKCTIILIELMYIVLVPFDWTRTLSPVCFLFVYNSMNFCVFDPFITR
jgi:hypothetical protein